MKRVDTDSDKGPAAAKQRGVHPTSSATKKGRGALMDNGLSRAILLSTFLAGVSFSGCNLVVGIEEVHTGASSSQGAGGAGGASCGSEGSGAADYSHVWSTVYGPAQSSGMAVAENGDVVLIGLTGDVSFGGIPLTGGYVVKLNADGKHVWSKSFAVDTLYDVRIDALGNIVILGGAMGMVDFGGGLLDFGEYNNYVASFDVDGSHRWSKVFGPPEPVATLHIYDLAVDGGGNVLLTGDFYGDVDFGGGVLSAPGAGKIFVAKLDAWGNHIWSKSFGDESGAQSGSVIEVDAFKNVLVTGRLSDKDNMTDFGGGPLTGSGNDDDTFLLKLDAGGDYLWSKRFGSFCCEKLATDSTGNILVGGLFSTKLDLGGGLITSSGDTDVFVSKLNASGDHLWTKAFGGPGTHYIEGIDTDSSDNVLLIGAFEQSIDFGGCELQSEAGAAIYAAKLDELGAGVWSKKLGTEGNQYGYEIGVDGADNLLLLGEPGGGEVDLGGGPLMGQDDAIVFFLGKLAP